MYRVSQNKGFGKQYMLCIQICVADFTWHLYMLLLAQVGKPILLCDKSKSSKYTCAVEVANIHVDKASLDLAVLALWLYHI